MMQLGTLAEWVTGITNIVAVCVALFLPMYQEEKKKKSAQRRIKMMATDIVNEMLVMLKNNSDEDITKSKAFENFHLLTTISAITDGDAINISILRQIQNLLVEHKNYSMEEMEEKIKQFLLKL